MTNSELSLVNQAKIELELRRRGIRTAPVNPTLDPLAWIQREFYIPETRAPLVLYPAQQVALQLALAEYPDGTFRYSTVLWSAIKKSAKSTIAAAVGLWFAWRKPLSSVKVLGNDLRQAESRVYEYMRRAILLHPEWRSSVTVNRNKIILPNGSTIEAIPVDPAGEAGGNDDCVIYTELWGWKSTRHQLMWSETTLSPTKYGRSMRWCESYAGYTGDSPVLEALYESAVTHGQPIGTDTECFERADARLFAYWNTVPTLPWQTPAYYTQEAAALLPTEFNRLHRNQWSAPMEALIPIAWWDACAGTVPAPGQYQATVVGIDAAVTNDCFAIVAVTRNGDQFEVRYARAWTPDGGRIDFAEPEAELRRLAATMQVAEFAYDPMQMEDMAMRLRNAGVGHFRPFPQGGDRLIADKGLYDVIRDRRILHDDSPLLREHLMNASAKAEGDKLRIVKRREGDKIDAAVALSMAVARARYLDIG